MAAITTTLRNGTWLTRARMRRVALAVLAASALGLIYLIATATGINDRLGRPLGTDYSNIYAAGRYVLAQEPAAPFDPARQHAKEQEIFGTATPFYGWHYPPFFLGPAAALARLPYLWSLALWQGVTLALYLIAIRAIATASVSPGTARDRLWLLLALAYPAVFINLGHGHNGFLTAALMTGALLSLDRRPVIAGILFGLMAYKPQFGVLVPLVLIATGRWRCFAAASATVLAMAALTTAAFGLDVWTAFLASTRFTREVVLEQGGTGWHKIQTVFSWARMWGADIPLAYAAQAIVTAAIAVSLVMFWRGNAPFARKAAALMIGTLLATPYSLDYDLMLLAPAIALLAIDGLRSGFAPWQGTMLATLWLMPLVSRSFAEATLIPLGAPTMLAFFAITVWPMRSASPVPQTAGVR